jgi:hypothetical protein
LATHNKSVRGSPSPSENYDFFALDYTFVCLSPEVIFASLEQKNIVMQTYVSLDMQLGIVIHTINKGILQLIRMVVLIRQVVRIQEHHLIHNILNINRIPNILMVHQVLQQQMLMNIILLMVTVLLMQHRMFMQIQMVCISEFNSFYIFSF